MPFERTVATIFLSSAYMESPLLTHRLADAGLVEIADFLEAVDPALACWIVVRVVEPVARVVVLASGFEVLD